MAYDETKLTNLAALKALAVKTKNELDEVSGKLGQNNIIETVKVNGAALSVANKTVDVTVPTKVGDLTNDKGYLVANDIANKADKATTLAGYNIGDAYTKTQVDGLVTGVLHYMGSYDTFAALTAAVTSPKQGDVYNIRTAGGKDENNVSIKAGDNVAYSGTGWDVLGGDVDLSAYATTSTMNTALGNKVDKVDGKGLSANDFTNTYKSQLDSLPAVATNTEVNEMLAEVFA